jgi:hypothetical protein
MESVPNNCPSHVSDQWSGFLHFLIYIQEFKWCHAKTRLVSIVIEEFCKWQVLFATCAKSKSTKLEHVFRNLIDSFHLTPVFGWQAVLKESQ